MPSLGLFFCASFALAASLSRAHGAQQAPLQRPHASPSNGSSISVDLFAELEELARIVDISYCVGSTGLGIQKPFQCLSRCSEFESFELVKTWNTGALLADSCGYIALSHPPSPPRIILAFRGTYSLTNTIVDLSTVPQAYVPYPGDDDDGDDGDDGLPSDFMTPRRPYSSPPINHNDNEIERDKHGRNDPPAADPPRCENCTVHMGFYSAWLNTRSVILPDLTAAIEQYPTYKLVLVGHSLGGAVAALAGLDFLARGWHPRVTTFGEPRIGNTELMAYTNARFNITSPTHRNNNSFHRITHANDPVPLLPLSEWGYSMHSEEIFISAPSLPPSVADLQHCEGNEDPKCIAGTENDGEGWGIPTRYRFWELFFAHRDYFWRLGLCVPGGDPRDWYRKYPKHGGEDDDDDVYDTKEMKEL